MAALSPQIFNRLASKWLSLGAGYSAPAVVSLSQANTDPEMTIIETLPYLISDPAFFSMILGSVRKFDDCYDEARLLDLLSSHQWNCSFDDQMSAYLALAVLAAKTKKNSNNWHVVEAYARDRLCGVDFKNIILFEGQDAVVIKITISASKVLDKEFMKFGIKYPVLTPVEDKKLCNRDQTIRNNTFFRLRQGV